MTRSKAYLFGGVEIRWRCAAQLLDADGKCRTRRRSISPTASRIISPPTSQARTLVVDQAFTGKVEQDGKHGAVEWAVAWIADADGFVHSYCNTIPTPDGGTHEAGLRAALLRGLKDHAERIGQGKRAAALTTDDVMTRLRRADLGVHPRAGIPGPEQGPAATAEAARHRRAAINDAFDHWLAARRARRRKLLDFAVERAEERIAPPPGKGHRPQERGAQAAAAGQARRLHQHLRARLGAVHRRGRFGGRLGQAGARPRDPGDPAAARQNPQRRLGDARQAGAEPAARRSRAGARLRHRRALSRRGPALRQDHHHDRRRRRRRAHRFAADHLLLPPNAEADRRRPPLSRGAAALPAHPRRQVALRARRRPQGGTRQDRLFRAAARSKSAASRASARCRCADLRDTTMDPAKRTLLRVALVADGRDRHRRRSRAADGQPGRRRASPSSRSGRPTRANSSTFNAAARIFYPAELKLLADEGERRRRLVRRD